MIATRDIGTFAAEALLKLDRRKEHARTARASRRHLCRSCEDLGRGDRGWQRAGRDHQQWLWKRSFGGSRSVIGKQIDLGGVAFTIRRCRTTGVFWRDGWGSARYLGHGYSVARVAKKPAGVHMA